MYHSSHEIVNYREGVELSGWKYENHYWQEQLKEGLEYGGISGIRTPMDQNMIKMILSVICSLLMFFKANVSIP